MVAKLVVDHHVAYSNFCFVVFVDLNVSYYNYTYIIMYIYIIIYILVYVMHKMLGLDGLGCYAHLTLVVESSYRKQDSQLMKPASRLSASCGTLLLVLLLLLPHRLLCSLSLAPSTAFSAPGTLLKNGELKHARTHKRKKTPQYTL